MQHRFRLAGLVLLLVIFVPVFGQDVNKKDVKKPDAKKKDDKNDDKKDDDDKKDVKKAEEKIIQVGPVMTGKLLSVQGVQKITVQFKVRAGKDWKDVNKDFELADKVMVRVEKLPPAFDDKGRVKTYTKEELAELKGEDKKEFGYAADMDLLKPNQFVRVFVGRPKSALKTDPLLVFKIHVAGDGRVE